VLHLFSKHVRKTDSRCQLAVSIGAALSSAACDPQPQMHPPRWKVCWPTLPATRAPSCSLCLAAAACRGGRPRFQQSHDLPVGAQQCLQASHGVLAQHANLWNPTLPCRRVEGQPFLSIEPAAEGSDLRAALGPAAAALEGMVSAAEAVLGRRLFAFQLDTSPLPPCAAGTGPCAVWEATSGRVVLDAALAAKMAGAAGAAGAAGTEGKAGEPVQLEQAAGASEGLPALLASFVAKLAEQLPPATERKSVGEGKRGG